MKLSNFLIISFLVLVPWDYANKCGPDGVFGDCASNYYGRKKNDVEENTYVHKTYYKPAADEITRQECVSPVPVPVQYESTRDEKYNESKKIKIKEDELCRKEIETVKDAAGKWKANQGEKSKKFDQSCGRNSNKLGSNEIRFIPSMKKGNAFCAECEQCEIQIKANGDGILLKCRDCREVPASDVVFPAGNNRRIIKLP